MTGRSSDKGNGGDRDAFVYNRDAIFTFNLPSDRNEIFCCTGDFIVNIFVYGIKIRIDAVQKTDAHRNCTDIQLFLLDHLVCFIDLKYIDHNRKFLSDAVHSGENIFMLASDLETNLIAYFL